MNDTVDNEIESSYNGSSLYNSALENTASTSTIPEISSDYILNNSDDSLAKTNSTEFNGSTLSENLNDDTSNHVDLKNMLNSSSVLLIQSERNEYNNSQDAADVKPVQTNKTILTTQLSDLPILENKIPSLSDNEEENDPKAIECNIETTNEKDNNEENLIGHSSTPRSPITKPNRHNAGYVKVPVYENENSLNSTPVKDRIEAKPTVSTTSVATLTDAEPIVTKPVSETPSKIITKTPIISPPTKRESIIVYDNIKEFESKLPPTVTLLETPFGSKVYLVGTAHFSEESQDDVSYVIRNVRPDFVVVELCPSRIHILKLDEKTLLEEAKNFNASKIRSIFQTHGYVNGFFFILFLHMSAQIAKELGMAPGGEFRRAFEEIHNLPGCVLQLGDRPINITLQRALRALSLWQIVKLVWRLTSTESITIEEVETCKERDLLSKLMQEMAGEFPAFSDVFVKERDLFLCHSLQLAAVPLPSYTGSRPVRVVGVVGIGHINGICENWGHVDPSQIPVICEIPPASMGTRICKYTFKCGLIGLILFGTYKVFKPRLSKLF